MKIPLNEFEQHIDEDILKRGLQYLKKGYVTCVDELSGGEYEATVEGSETYTVHMEIKNGVLNGCDCTCPYDWGPVCKHEVALMFYLQQEELGIEAKSGKGVKKNQVSASLGVKPSLKNRCRIGDLRPTQKRKPYQRRRAKSKTCCKKSVA